MAGGRIISSDDRSSEANDRAGVTTDARSSRPEMPTDCGGPYDLAPEHMITCWEEEPTSPAERTVIDYLLARPEDYAGRRLLHVGIGNSTLPKLLLPRLGAYRGITISQPEMDLFRRAFPDRPEAAILLNKHDHRMYARLDGRFDLIVDTLLKSYACCERHFIDMMRFYAELLNPGAVLLTTVRGLGWGWLGNTARAYTPGARADRAMAQARTIGVGALAALAGEIGLTMETEAVSDAETGDRVIRLLKDHPG